MAGLAFVFILVVLVVAALAAGLLAVTGIAAIVAAKMGRLRGRWRKVALVGGPVAVLVSLVVLVPIAILGAAVYKDQRERPDRDSAKAFLRSVMVAEGTYSTHNGGFYDTLECLARPSSCIPGYEGPAFVATEDLERPRPKYTVTFHPGPPAPAEAMESGTISRSSVIRYAILAAPRDVGMWQRTLCADSSGTFCSFSGGGLNVAGVCPADCSHEFS